MPRPRAAWLAAPGHSPGRARVPESGGPGSAARQIIWHPGPGPRRSDDQDRIQPPGTRKCGAGRLPDYGPITDSVGVERAAALTLRLQLPARPRRRDGAGRGPPVRTSGGMNFRGRSA
eukprot:675658-Hanusia_phi.AAC.1